MPLTTLVQSHDSAVSVKRTFLRPLVPAIALVIVAMLGSGAAAQEQADVEHWPSPLELRRDLQEVGYTFELTNDHGFASLEFTVRESSTTLSQPWYWVGGTGESRGVFFGIPAFEREALPLYLQIDQVAGQGYGPAINALGDMVERLPLDSRGRMVAFELLGELDVDAAEPACVHEQLDDVTVAVVDGGGYGDPIVIFARDPSAAFPFVWSSEQGEFTFAECWDRVKGPRPTPTPTPTPTHTPRPTPTPTPDVLAHASPITSKSALHSSDDDPAAEYPLTAGRYRMQWIASDCEQVDILIRQVDGDFMYPKRSRSSYATATVNDLPSGMYSIEQLEADCNEWAIRLDWMTH